jgi:hypothetical protein
MSKYAITHACGHTVTHNICGKVSERDALVDWKSRHDCPECYAKEMKAERAAEQAAALKASEELPALTGTEKQVAWASKIRAAFFSDAKERNAKGFLELPEEEREAARKRALDLLVYFTSAETTARWWIDNKALTQEGNPGPVIEAISILHPEGDEFLKSNFPHLHPIAIAERDKRFGKKAERDQKKGDVFTVPAHAIAQMKFVPKIGKYFAEIEFHGHPKREFWISEKQAKALDEAFAGERYSTKTNQAYVTLEQRDKKLRFVWASSNEPKARKSSDFFGASWGWPGECD